MRLRPGLRWGPGLLEAGLGREGVVKGAERTGRKGRGSEGNEELGREEGSKGGSQAP